MKNIYLIGFMGVGKSTFGKKLARELGYRFVDLDVFFEEKFKIGISRFFEKYDEILFRKLENQLLTETFGMQQLVVATGGGTPCYFNAIKDVNRNGISIYLKMDAAAIAHRLTHAKKPRPLIAGKTGMELEETIKKKLRVRKPFYEQAQLTVNALNIDAGQVAGMVKRML